MLDDPLRIPRRDLEYAWEQKECRMATEIVKRRFTVDEYQKMGQAGILRERDRVELIDGEIIEMSPIGRSHCACVIAATELFGKSFVGRALLSVQNPLKLDDKTEPEPDVVVLKPSRDCYRTVDPSPRNDFLLLVADSSLSYDLHVKTPRYAQAGIPEVWIEDLGNEALLVFRDPSGENYQTTRTSTPSLPSPFPM
jgi:Uma2 family endonuclease